MPRGAAAECYRCHAALERTAGRSAGLALALSMAALALFIPGNILPAMRSDLLGSSVEARAIDGVSAFFGDGWPVLASFVAMFVIVTPILRAAFLVAVLGALGLGYRRLWQGRVFRLAQALRYWSMAEVYLAAGAVTYSRVAAQLDIELLPGGWCFIAAVLLLTMAEAALDKRRIWSALLPNPPLVPEGGVLSCLGCQLIMPITAACSRCPRCARRLSIRRRDSLERTTALTIAAIILLYPALFLPMIVTVQPNGVMESTIFGGVRQLFQHGYWYLGLIVFAFSIVIPGLKLFTLLWLTLSVRFPHRRFLLFRSRLHRFIDSINHWSFIDPFIVALNVAMLSFPGVISASAAAGSLAFSLVIVLTMVASRMFDSRLMWDAVERREPARQKGAVHA